MKRKDSMENAKFGQKVAELRKSHGLSQYQLGSLVGVTYQAVSKWETKGVVPKRTVVDKLCGVLGFDFNPIIDDNLTPDEADKLISRQKEILWEKAEERMKDLYGEEPPLPVTNRFIVERNVLRRSKNVILFDIISEIRKAARQKQARFDASGCECFVSWLLGATDVNPLEPHLLCPKCHRMEFHPEVQSGWDLKDQICECGGRMEPDGQNIPVETCVLGEGDLYEHFRCAVDTSFLDEAERIILTCGEQYFAMEKYREYEREEYDLDPETGKKIKITRLPISVLIFRPKKKAKIRKPEKIGGPSEVINWGERTGQPTIALLGGFFEPYYLSGPSPFRSSPDELVRPDIMERALKDYWEWLPGWLEMRAATKLPDILPYLKKLTFGKLVSLLCSAHNLYMTSGPEELAEKIGITDLTKMPSSVEDIWNLISRYTPNQGYMNGAAGEIVLNIRKGKYLEGPYLPGPQPRDLKLFRELNLPEWFRTYVSNVFSLQYRTPYIDLAIRLLEDARRKIREGK